MADDIPADDPNNDDVPAENTAEDGVHKPADRIADLDIRDEMQQSYLSYAMSVIVSRALPDVRDGLKPVQRRILVAMNDANLSPNSGRVKCAKISGDTSGNYHPHGTASIYPTVVRMAQGWSLREVLIDKQGNFGSLAGLGPAAERYTEARLAPAAMEMLTDIDRNTVDYVPTYDQSRLEPTVLPARFPNLLVNGSTGIAVGMATSIPPHNLGEVADAVTMLIDNPESEVDDLMECVQGPDFPTGGIIMGRHGIRQAYSTGRSTITVRAKTHVEMEKKTQVIVVSEIPYQETRDRIRLKIEELIRDDRIKGISKIDDFTDRKVPEWQGRLHIYLKRDADPDVVLNTLYKFSPLQTTFSMIMLALVGGRPQTLTLKEMLQEFLRHRVEVIRRRTEHTLNEARKRKHTVEGLLIAQLDIDTVIKTIRDSSSRAEAKVALQEIKVPGELIARALGDDGFKEFTIDQGEGPDYSLSPNQAEAIVSMQLGSLANLERDRLADDHRALLETIKECVDLLSDESNIRAVVRDDMQELKGKYNSPRRTECSLEELTDVNRDDLITEEPMVVTLSRRGYIKRTALTEYQSQRRGGKGITGAKTDEEDPIERLFVSSTHAWLLFFTNKGKVYWSKVYDLPQQGRTAKGRAMANLLTFQFEDERVENCVAVREWDDKNDPDAGRSLMIVTRKGIVKKSALVDYSRPKKGGIIAIKLDEDDALIDVDKVGQGDDVVLSTATGMAIRFAESDARQLGRNSRGVKGINLGKNDYVVGLEVVDTEADLLTISENGYGKRTPFGVIADESDSEDANSDDPNSDNSESTDDTDASAEADASETSSTSSTQRYRRQKRGGKGLRDLKTGDRNGPAMGILAVKDDDEVLLVSSKGKIQRISAAGISRVGRNTQGVRIMSLNDGDTVASIASIPAGVAVEEAEEATPEAE